MLIPAVYDKLFITLHKFHNVNWSKNIIIHPTSFSIPNGQEMNRKLNDLAFACLANVPWDFSGLYSIKKETRKLFICLSNATAEYFRLINYSVLIPIGYAN